MSRPLQPHEIDELLESIVPLRLATIDDDGYPHVTPLWFIRDGSAIVMTSFEGRSHLRRARANPRVGLVIDIEAALRPDGERPNRQVRIRGDATVLPDTGYEWTTRIRSRYIDTDVAPGVAQKVQSRPRALIRVEPRTLIALSSV